MKPHEFRATPISAGLAGVLVAVAFELSHYHLVPEWAAIALFFLLFLSLVAGPAYFFKQYQFQDQNHWSVERFRILYIPAWLRMLCFVVGFIAAIAIASLLLIRR